MDREAFEKQIAALSNEAVEGRLQDEEERAYQVKREHVKQTLVWGIIALLYGVALTRHAEIRDTIAKLFETGPMEYHEIMDIAKETDEEAEANSSDNNPRSARKAQLRDTMKQAKRRATEVDGIMDNKPTDKD